MGCQQDCFDRNKEQTEAEAWQGQYCDHKYCAGFRQARWPERLYTIVVRRATAIPLPVLGRGLERSVLAQRKAKYVMRQWHHAPTGQWGHLVLLCLPRGAPALSTTDKRSIDLLVATLDCESSDVHGMYYACVDMGAHLLRVLSTWCEHAAQGNVHGDVSLLDNLIEDLSEAVADPCYLPEERSGQGSHVLTVRDVETLALVRKQPERELGIASLDSDSLYTRLSRATVDLLRR